MIFGGGGGVGDAYLYLCAIKPLAREGDIVRWWSDNEEMVLREHRPAIEQTFRLLPTVSLEYIETEREMYSQEGPRINIGPAALRNPVKPDYFPTWNFPALPSNIEPGCVVLVPTAGRTNHQDGRRLSSRAAQVISESTTRQVVVLGSHEFPVRGSNMLNLCGRTTLLEAYAIVAQASEFYGTQGALCYVAVSHRVPSKIHSAVGWMREEFEARLWAPYREYYTPWSPS